MSSGRRTRHVDFPWSEDGVPADAEVRKLLADRDFGATPQAAQDLEAGVVDERLVGVLRTLTEEHRVCVEAFKEGHFFEPGILTDPASPKAMVRPAACPTPTTSGGPPTCTG